MRPPPKIKPHLPIEQMFNWLQAAPDQDAYKRRMALWLAHTGNLHAHRIAQVLGVSKQAVWLWVGQYNRLGPKGLDRKGRGGRRWAFLSRWQEQQLLKPFIKDVRSGKRPKTKEIKSISQKADILIVAMGKAEFVTGKFVKDGAIVIDVGTNEKNGKMVGDVHYESVEKKAAAITPVPGGVGSITTAMLLSNLYKL